MQKYYAARDEFEINLNPYQLIPMSQIDLMVEFADESKSLRKQLEKVRKNLKSSFVVDIIIEDLLKETLQALEIVKRMKQKRAQQKVS
jgi:RNase H-fold protein (predicted Holliday junction resolvase)